ncbi:MAG: alpha-xenorhabdolysin family binary toxin subunit A [Pseudomonadota bacterium]|nr:alpha-xenorhabdolysin family binary toxin subunit A [Pseudomonadota bacterium]
MDNPTSSPSKRFTAFSSAANDGKAIGPGALDSGSGTFVLAVPGWLAVQCYVTAGMRLPTDAATMRAQLPADPAGGIGQFADLIQAYAAAHAHCTFWHDHTLQDAVSCAADIVHYNQKVPSYYGALTALLPKLALRPLEPTAVAQFATILENLATQAQACAGHAESVHQGMKWFAEQTAQDQLTIAPLRAKYAKALGSQSPAIEQLAQQLGADQQTLSQAQDDYQRDVIVTSTGATYAWIWPAGAIAAGVVTGIYGRKASDALARVNAIKATISTMPSELAAAATLLLDLTSIEGQLAGIGDQIASALPVLQTIQGAWTAIASDMQNILTIIADDISAAPALIKSLGIDDALAAWAAVAREADAYRNTAFISVSAPARAKVAGLALQGSLVRLAKRSEAARKRAANYM